jgi:hypothetical protein
MFESIERIRHSTSTDGRHSIFINTIEFLKSNEREDLCKRFTNEFQSVISESKLAKESSSSTAVLTGDNLNEENMEVDDEQDDKHKKQLSISEYNDVDYRFLDQDMDHRMTTIISENDRDKDITRKSRFSDVLSSDRDADDRTIKSHLMDDGREKRTRIIGSDSDFRTNDTRIASPR